MRAWLLRYIGIIAVIVGLGCVWGLYFSVWSEYELLQRNSLAQLFIGMGTFIAVIFTVLYAAGQFRKVTAQPELSIVFDDKGNKDTATSLKAPTRAIIYTRLELPMYVFNSGNAIATDYQIELAVPNIFDMYVPNLNIPYPPWRKRGYSDDQKTILFSYFISKGGEFTSYVGEYVPIGTLFLVFEHNTKSFKHQPTLEIKYRIFGDWRKPCEGLLKVNWIQGQVEKQLKGGTEAHTTT
ncbi:hypothetical protein ES703_16145 [subsurface metagenome]